MCVDIAAPIIRGGELRRNAAFFYKADLAEAAMPFQPHSESNVGAS
jgi:hypothetical protein